LRHRSENFIDAGKVMNRAYDQLDTGFTRGGFDFRYRPPLAPAFALSGLINIEARLMEGAISLNSSTHLPPIGSSMLVKPVMFPPGDQSFSQNPGLIGSATPTNTIGIVLVSCLRTATIGVLLAMMTSTGWLTNWDAKASIRSVLPATQRTSISTLVPSAHPSLPN
jgi:hypothetical protein